MEVRSDRRYQFDVPPDAVWDAMASVDDFRRWWPWLRRFDARGLEAGDRWSCTVRPPLPYALRFSIALEEVHRPLQVQASVTGDVCGQATVDISPDGDGSEVRLRSSLAPAGRALRTVSRFTPWLAEFGHDWVLDTGLRQFRRRALGPHA
jgi:hypothetical protein